MKTLDQKIQDLKKRSEIFKYKKHVYVEIQRMIREYELESTVNNQEKY